MEQASVQGHTQKKDRSAHKTRNALWMRARMCEGWETFLVADDGGVGRGKGRCGKELEVLEPLLEEVDLGSDLSNMGTQAVPQAPGGNYDTWKIGKRKVDGKELDWRRMSSVRGNGCEILGYLEQKAHGKALQAHSALANEMELFFLGCEYQITLSQYDLACIPGKNLPIPGQ